MSQVFTRDGQIKRTDAAVPKGIVCRYRRITNQTNMNAAGWWKVTFDQTIFDVYGLYNTTTQRLQPKSPGYYRITFGYLSSIAGTQIGIRKNAGNRIQGDTGTQGNITATVYLNGDTDYVELETYVAGAATITGSTGDDYTWFEAELVASTVGVAPEPWHYIGAPGEPAFQPNWSNFGTATDYNVARFRKKPDGEVVLEGMIRMNPATNGALAFVLPVGYRPAKPTIFLVPMGVAGDTHSHVYVYPNGNVNVYGNAGYSFTGNAWVDLAIRFFTD